MIWKLRIFWVWESFRPWALRVYGAVTCSGHCKSDKSIRRTGHLTLVFLVQAEESDFVYLMDDDMIPGKKMLQILAHVGGTEKYRNAVLGSIGRILPFKQKDESFPSYRKFGSKEAGLYLPDPAYDIIVDRIVKVDFLSSSWFLSTHLVKTIFTETPFTFSTGEDLHLRWNILPEPTCSLYHNPYQTLVLDFISSA